MLKTSSKFGKSSRFVDIAFLSEDSKQQNVNENLVQKQKCMAILFQEYFTKGSIAKTIVNDGKTYRLEQSIADEFQYLIDQRPPNAVLSQVVKHLSGTLDKISIGDVSIFLKRLIDERQKINNEFNKLKSDFKSIDQQDTYATLLDKVRGCTNQCPCCKRPCDVDHTQLQSNAGAEFNEHRCSTGHSLRAMNGYKFEGSGEASLFMCEQIKDYQEIIIGPTRYQWSQYKKDHPDWKFDSVLTEDELSRLHGKYLTIWARIGPTLCEQYGMKFVTFNDAKLAKPQSFHYILLLDNSGSMSNNQRWTHLMNAVNEFLQRRRDMGTNDRFTIITFSSMAMIAFENKSLESIDTASLGLPNGDTSFSQAFKCVKETIEKCKNYDKSNPLHDNITVLFMSDGKASYPDRELKQLKEKYESSIKHFWTIAVCEDGSTHKAILKKINVEMNGSFYSVEKASELVKAYAEIASTV